MKGSRVVLYDGHCKLCNRTVRWVKRNDRMGAFSFRPHPGDSVVLQEGEKRYERSTAVLRIAMGLRIPWPLLGVFLIVPRVFRDAIYNIVARNRKQWFGVYKSCTLPED